MGVYIPKSFQWQDEDEISEFITRHSFALLITSEDNHPLCTHLPMYYDKDKQMLLAHMAKANSQWRAMDGSPCLCIFSGPHAFISPEWYDLPQSVPTWNYVAVHIQGTCRLVKDEIELEEILEKLIYAYEPHSKLPMDSKQHYYQQMMKAIVGFKVEIDLVEGCKKLSQNKPLAVQQRVIEQLQAKNDWNDVQVARWMQKNIVQK